MNPLFEDITANSGWDGLGFFVGQRVVCNGAMSGNNAVIGKTGTIKMIGKDGDRALCSVEFDEKIPFGHVGIGHSCKDGHGYNIRLYDERSPLLAPLEGGFVSPLDELF